MEENNTNLLPENSKNEPEEKVNSDNMKEIKYRRVPKKKILYIEIDDEITAVYDQIKNQKISDIYIVVPKRAALFQSTINLKILKKKLEEIGKELHIVTNDKIGIHLAHQAGIKVYDKIEENIISTNPDKVDAKLKISPLKATKNAFDEDLPCRLPEKKVSIMEIVKNAKNGNKNVVTSLFGSFWKKNKSAKRSRIKTSFFKGNKGLLSGFIFISLIVLLAIIYIALPGVTLYLTPKSNVIEKSVNIILADYKRNEAELKTHPAHTIAYFPITLPGPIKATMIYQSTGGIFRGENARGQITITNEAKKDWTLIPKTRFQSADGLVFRISNYVKVPPATANGKGIIRVEVVADEKDVNGKVIGERGNIGPTKFILPGLKEDSQKQIYGENTEPMTGGKTNVTKMVIAADIEAAKKKAREMVLDKIISSLDEQVALKNQAENTNLVLLKEQKLDWQRAIKSDEPVISVPPDILNKEMDSFEVTAQVNASGVAYKSNELLDILKNELKTKKSPEKKIIKIDDASLSYRLFEEDINNKKFSITATIKGIEQYELDAEKENGARLIKKIKEHIVGKDIKEAEDYIQNLPEIHKVEIKSWPIWAPTIPSVPGNIEIKIVNE